MIYLLDLHRVVNIKVSSNKVALLWGERPFGLAKGWRKFNAK